MEDFFNFLESCPTPYHFISYAREELTKNGFVELKETEDFNLAGKDIQNAFVIRDEKSLIAFKLNSKQEASNDSPSIIGVCTNSDVPCLKLKANYLQNVKSVECKNEDDISEDTSNSSYQLIRLAQYGSALWHTYLDHDLKVAGAVCIRNPSTNQFERRLIDSKRGIMVIPNIAIHNNPTISLSPNYNAEKHLHAIFSVTNDNGTKPTFKEYILSLLNDPKLTVDDIVDWDISIIGSQESSHLNDSIFASGLSNHSNCYASLKAFLTQRSKSTEKVPIQLLAVFDEALNSGVGRDGAKGTFLGSVLDKIYHNFKPASIPEQLSIKSRSLLVSLSTLHCTHPNQTTSYTNDSMNPATFGKGPILRCTTRSGLTTDIHGIAAIKTASNNAGIPLQVHIPSNKSNVPRTQGPSLQLVSGILTTDIANPILAKYSIREMMNWSDIINMEKLLEELYYGYDKCRVSNEIVHTE